MLLQSGGIWRRPFDVCQSDEKTVGSSEFGEGKWEGLGFIHLRSFGNALRRSVRPKLEGAPVDLNVSVHRVGRSLQVPLADKTPWCVRVCARARPCVIGAREGRSGSGGLRSIYGTITRYNRTSTIKRKERAMQGANIVCAVPRKPPLIPELTRSYDVRHDVDYDRRGGRGRGLQVGRHVRCHGLWFKSEGLSA